MSNAELEKSYYLNEFEFFNGDDFITFNILDLNLDRNIITVAVTNSGKISVITYDLIDEEGRIYFEFGMNCDEIELDNFEEVEL